MSATEADSTVLQPLTNGDIIPSAHTKDEVDDSKENLDLNSTLKALASEVVEKATEMTAEAFNPLVSELENDFHTQSPAADALSPADAPLPSKVNGVTEGRVITSPALSVNADADAEPTTVVAEEQATSLNEDALAKPKEDILEPVPAPSAPTEQETAGESPVEITKDLESADHAADAAAAGAEDVNADGDAPASTVDVTPAAAVEAGLPVVEDVDGKIEPVSVPSNGPGEEDAAAAESETVAGEAEVPSSSAESEDVPTAAVDVVAEDAPIAEEPAAVEPEVAEAALPEAAMTNTETLAIEPTVVDEVPPTAVESIEETIPAEAVESATTEPVEAVPSEAEPVAEALADVVVAEEPAAVEPEVAEAAVAAAPITIEETFPVEPIVVDEVPPTAVESIEETIPAEAVEPAATEPVQANPSEAEPVPEVINVDVMVAEEPAAVEPEVVEAASEAPITITETFPVEPTVVDEVPPTTVESIEETIPAEAAAEPVQASPSEAEPVPEALADVVVAEEPAAVEPEVVEAVPEAAFTLTETLPVEPAVVDEVPPPAVEYIEETIPAEAVESAAAELVQASPSEAEPVPEALAIEEPSAQSETVAAESIVDDEVSTLTTEVAVDTVEPVELAVVDSLAAQEPPVLASPVTEGLAVTESETVADAPEATTSTAQDAASPAATAVTESEEAIPATEESAVYETDVVPEASEFAIADPLGESLLAEPSTTDDAPAPVAKSIEEPAAVEAVEAVPMAENIPTETDTVATEPEVVETPFESGGVEEVPAPASESIAEAESAAEPEVIEQPLVESSIVDDVSVPALEPTTETAAEFEATEKAPIESPFVEEVSPLTAEPVADVAPVEAVEVVSDVDHTQIVDSEKVDEAATGAGPAPGPVVMEEPAPADEVITDTVNDVAVPADEATPVIINEVDEVSEHKDLALEDEGSIKEEEVVSAEPDIPEGTIAAVADEAPAAVDDAGKDIEPEANAAVAEDLPETALAETPVVASVSAEFESLNDGPATKADPITETLPAEDAHEAVSAVTTIAEEPINTQEPEAASDKVVEVAEEVSQADGEAGTTPVTQPTSIQEPAGVDEELVVADEIPPVVEEIAPEAQDEPTVAPSPVEGPAASKHEDYSHAEPTLESLVTAEDLLTLEEPVAPKDEEVAAAVENAASLASDIFEEPAVVEEPMQTPQADVEEASSPIPFVEETGLAESAVPQEQEEVAPVTEEHPATSPAAIEETIGHDSETPQMQEEAALVAEEQTIVQELEAPLEQEEAVAPAAEALVSAEGAPSEEQTTVSEEVPVSADELATSPAADTAKQDDLFVEESAPEDQVSSSTELPMVAQPDEIPAAEEQPAEGVFEEDMEIAEQSNTEIIPEVVSETPYASEETVPSADIQSEESTVDVEVRSAPLEDDSLVVETEIDRPKSPWMPSFQVTTVGRGAEPEEEQAAESEETVIPTAEVGTTSAEVQEEESKPVEEELLIAAPITSEVEESTEDADHTTVAPPQLLVDTSSLEEPTEEPRSWTPSYSVHSQGSPGQSNSELQEADTQEEHPRSWTPSYSVHSQGSPLITQAELVEEAPVPQSELIDNQEHEVAELEDMEFATNEEAPVANDVPAQETTLETDEAPTETLVEQTELPVETATPDAIAEAPSEQDATSTAVEAVEVEDMAPAPDAQVPQLVVDTSDEATQPSADDGEQSSMLLSAHSQQERPASPSWVASYSVSVQGSPSQERSDPLEETIFNKDQVAAPVTPVDESAFVETVEPNVVAVEDASEVAPQIVVTPDTLPEEEELDLATSDTPSFIVQASDVLAETVEVPSVNDDSDNVVSSEVPVAAKELLGVGDDGDNDKDMSNANDVAPLLSANSEEQEPPKSPWTPSYSVTTQGPNTASEEAELDALEPLTESAVSVEAANGEVQGSQDTTADKPDDSIPSVTVDAADPMLDAAGEVFPTAESADHTTEQTKSTSLRLASLNENAVVDGSLASPDAVSPTSARTRLESTASSRFFPGSWFSPSYKVVDEGRASLEIARGEFIAAKTAASVDEAPDTSAAAEVSSVDSDDSDEEPESATSEQKRKWCVIM